MSATKRRVIVLRGNPEINEENMAAEAITPGHLVNFNRDGNLVKNTVDGEVVSRSFALERDEFGSGIDVAYASGDMVKVGAFDGGDRVLALTPSGQNLAKGDRLEADDKGMLVALGSGAVLARATEAVNNTSGPDPARVPVEII